MWDSGNPVGEFDGISKRCNSCDFKPSRPFRIVTGAEDFKTNLYEGPPFKFSVIIPSGIYQCCTHTRKETGSVGIY